MAIRTLRVLVPNPGSAAALRIDPGSGIVTDADGEHLLVYFEGNRYGTAKTYPDRVELAAGRCFERYPTIAKGLFAASDFAVVGEFRVNGAWNSRELVIQDPERLTAWLGTEEQTP